jgi:hypothetical protein
MEHWWKRFNFVANLNRKKYYDDSADDNFGNWGHLHLGVSPLGLHFSMFFKTILMLASEKQ